MDETPPGFNWEHEYDTDLGAPVRLAYAELEGVSVVVVDPPLAEKGTRSLELAAGYNLRDKLRLVDGSRVEVTYC
jgi:CTP-dependent riboflavin kinase